jgi:hypothetical protein
MGSLYISDVEAHEREWLGYEEGDNNWTIFSKILDDCFYYDPQYKQNQPWCANFQNCMFLISALPKDRDDEAKKYDAQFFQYQPSKNNLSCGCVYYAQYFKDAGAWYSRKEAKRGDIIFFGSLGAEEHVGFVTKVEDGRIYTIEGNKNNRVQECDYSINYTRIAGVGRPRWDGDEAPKETSKPKEDPKPSTQKPSKPNEDIFTKPTKPSKPSKPEKADNEYVVKPCRFVQVRKGPSAFYMVVDRLPSGTKVTVSKIENGFGCVGTNRWVSMDYLVK